MTKKQEKWYADHLSFKYGDLCFSQTFNHLTLSRSSHGKFMFSVEDGNTFHTNKDSIVVTRRQISDIVDLMKKIINEDPAELTAEAGHWLTINVHRRQNEEYYFELTVRADDATGTLYSDKEDLPKVVGFIEKMLKEQAEESDETLKITHEIK